MQIETNDLKTFKTYASLKNVKVQTVYLWEKLKQIKVVQIDGRKFVVLDKN